jgi:hypothetical protein
VLVETVLIVFVTMLNYVRSNSDADGTGIFKYIWHHESRTSNQLTEKLESWKLQPELNI